MGRKKRGRSRNGGAAEAPLAVSNLKEVSLPGPVPRFEIPGWRNRYGVVAGITGRGSEGGRGFDLGLWSQQPVAEVMSRWLAFRRAMPDFQAFALGNQVHGTELMRLDRGRGWIQVEAIDGWITTTPGILLTVTIADCVPVYLLAPKRGVALLHAGWRGTADGILPRAVDQLCAASGAFPASIIMHCGVGICGQCYEVGSEVLERCSLVPEGAGPWYLDLHQCLVGQARELGIQQITTSTWCSAHDRSLFYSHRASRGTDGRMVAFLGIAVGRSSRSRIDSRRPGA